MTLTLKQLLVIGSLCCGLGAMVGGLTMLAFANGQIQELTVSRDGVRMIARNYAEVLRTPSVP